MPGGCACCSSRTGRRVVKPKRATCPNCGRLVCHGASNEQRNVLWLTIEVPGIYCDDFYQAAEDGFTPMDCLLDGMDDQAVLVLRLLGDESGPELAPPRRVSVQREHQ